MRERLKKLIEHMDGVCPSRLSCYNCPHKEVGEGCSILAKVDYLIANDVVPVVRCKDCAKWESNGTCRDDGYCHNPKFHLHYGKVIERLFMPLTKSTDFCSYGERRTDEAL